VALTRPSGLLKALTKTVIETALEEEMAEHLGYDKHDPVAETAATPATGNAPRRC
jgi:putative transposase